MYSVERHDSCATDRLKVGVLLQEADFCTAESAGNRYETNRSNIPNE